MDSGRITAKIVLQSQACQGGGPVVVYMKTNPRNTIPLLILSGYALILLAVLALGWYSSRNARQLQAFTQDIYTHPFAVSNAAARLDGALFHLQDHIDQVVLIRDEAYTLHALRTETEEFARMARADLEVINASFLGDMSRVEELEHKLRQWDGIRLKIYARVEAGDYDAAKHLLETLGAPKFAEIIPHVDYILSFALERAKQYVEDAGRRSELIAVRTGWLIALLVIFIVLISSAVFSRVRHLQQEHDQSLRRLMNAESKLREDQARTQLAKAERANQAKSEFLSRMSHELRTPLHAIIAFSDLILYEKNLEPKLKNHIQQINNAGDHLLTLIDDVLDLARIESGKLTIAVEPVRLQAVLDECYSLIKPTMTDAGINLSFDTKVDYIVEADHTSLKQALLNILSNAVKYNRPQGHVSVSYEVREGNRLRINILDTGNGLSAEQQTQLFKPFERIGAEFTQVKGTGIGLTITQQLVNMMGGIVGVDSTEGEGSNFWIELVLSKKEPAVSKSAPARRTITQTAQSKNIIYVEDDPINARLMTDIIDRMSNHHLEIARTGKEGLQLIFENKPDLVLLDLNLPDMDGYQILEQIRAHPETRKIPAIAMTAKAMMADVERGARAGFDDYIVKPARAAEILKSIELVQPRENMDTHQLGEFRVGPVQVIE